MAALAILNPDPGRAAETDPVALSLRILAAARRSGDGGETLRGLTGQLHATDPAAIEGDRARLAFWMNIYNSLLLDRLDREPIAGNMLRHPRLFSRTAYLVGAEPYTLNLIEHGVLRRNSPAPFHPRRPLRPGDRRLGSLPGRLDPRIHFALNCGARSCPPIRLYEAGSVDAELEAATQAYLEAETTVDRARGRIGLPGLMRLYSRDFGDRREQIEFAGRRLPDVAAAAAEGPLRVRYERFDWTAART
jgi:hypothetical protein